MLNKELLIRGEAARQGENLVQFQKSRMIAAKKKLEDFCQQQKQVQISKDKLYEKYAARKIDAAEYRERVGELTEELSSLSVKQEKLQYELDCMEEESRRYEEDMKQIIRYSHMEELTQEMVDVFIKKISVYKDKNVEIEWNFNEGRNYSQVEAT